MRRRDFLVGLPMMYLAWPGAVDPCKVVLLASYDSATDINDAPYYLDVEAGGPSFSGYDISSTAKFGAGSLDVVVGNATEMSVWLNSSFDSLGIAFKGSATIEWRMRRPGGLQSTGLGTSETSFLNFELRFSDGDILYFNFGYYGSAFSAQDQGAGLRVFTENGPSASGIYRETGYGWTDDGWHAIRVTLTGGDTVLLHVDGDYKTSVSVGPLAISGVTLDSVAFNGGKTFPTTTDELQIDELRVTLNRAHSDATDYTPATGPWVDATCDSEVDEPAVIPSTLLLHFDGADGSTVINDSSAFARVLAGNANCKISTAQSKFGGSSLHVTRVNSGGVIAATHADFARTNNQPWTCEFWLYRVDGVSGNLNALFDWRQTGVAYENLSLLESGASQYIQYDNDAFGSQEPSPPTITTNTWHHIALTYDGTTITRWVNGVSDYTLTTGRAAMTSAEVRVGGAIGGSVGASDATDHYIDEFRLVIGTAVYTAPFTPPAAPFT